MFGCDELPRVRVASPRKVAPTDAPPGISPHLRREIDALREILPPEGSASVRDITGALLYVSRILLPVSPLSVSESLIISDIQKFYICIE